MSPNKSTIPNAAVGPLGEFQPPRCELMDYGIRTAYFTKEGEQQLHGPAHLGVWVEYDRVGIVVAQPDGQRETQFTFPGFVQFSALEAGAEEMQLCLRHLGLQAKQKPVVEIRRIVAAVLVDDRSTMYSPAGPSVMVPMRALAVGWPSGVTPYGEK